MFNVVVGICWQTSLVALPIYIVIRNTSAAMAALAVAAVTSVVLKFSWYDHLREMEETTEAASRPQPAPALSERA